MVVHTESGRSRSASGETPVEASVLKAVICEETVRVCLQAHGEQSRAIVLTGSLARDEATVVGIEGQWKLWGDAEFFLVFHDRATLPGAAALESLAGEIESSLLRRKVSCRIGLSAVQARYFRGLQPHIFAYELRKWGTTVWGDSNVLSLIPEFAASEIPLEDAWRLLCNRVIEQLEMAAETAAGTEDGGCHLQYRTAKLYLDMATSYLVFRGAYSPSYRQRSEVLSRLEKETLPAERPPFSLRDFADRVAASTQFKLTGSIPEGSFLTLPKSNLDLWKESLSIARGLWRWELARLAGVEGDRSDRELVRAWMRRQPLSQRLRGWLYAVRDRGWVRSWADWPRWARLAWRASPRYWVYAVASELLGQLAGPPQSLSQGEESAVDFDGLRSWLPALPERGSAGPPSQRLAADVVWNYHEFLTKTRA
jgi:hypothetical protein